VDGKSARGYYEYAEIGVDIIITDDVATARSAAELFK
jgi:hypothetical protein